MGDITVKLYDETPGHRDNFIKLVKEGMYDNTLFHRVIKNFMIQAGDPESKTASDTASLGSGDVGYTIPAEFNPKFIHKKGALAAARQGDEVNPKKESSGCQFYIVTGQVFSEEQLLDLEQRMRDAQLTAIFNSLAQKRIKDIYKMRRAGDNDGLMALQDELENQAREIMKEEIREWGGNISYSLISGNFTYQFNKLEPDTEYLALAFGYQAGVNTTPLTKKSIRTLPAGNPGECTFEFEIKPIGTSLSVSVTPSDETVNYFWNLYGADATQEEMKAAVLESLESTLAEGYYENEMEFWLNETARGNDTYLFMGLDKEKEYKAGAVAIDLTTCEMVGDFTESEIIGFKSESSTSIKVSYEKYFNGDEAAALSPEYSEFTGKAMVPFTVQVSGATTYRWVVTEWEEDYDSASDGMFWSTLGWDGYENEASRYVALEWDKDYTVYAMSVDADGNKSERFSMPVRFSRDGASPINELTE